MMQIRHLCFVQRARGLLHILRRCTPVRRPNARRYMHGWSIPPFCKIRAYYLFRGTFLRFVPTSARLAERRFLANALCTVPALEVPQKVAPSWAPCSNRTFSRSGHAIQHMIIDSALS